MARKLRLEYAGAVYHVTNRGDRREPVFRDDQDREQFVETLAAVCAKTGWQVHAYCLLPDHFHLVIETPQPNLVSGMKWLLGTFSNRLNRRHRVTGHVFAGRYKAPPIEAGGECFLLACEHVHLNPARAGLVAPNQPLSAFGWSSLPHYLKAPLERPGWLRVDRLFDAAQLDDQAEGRRALARRLETRRVSQRPGDWAGLRRGWCYGSDNFRRGLLDRLASGTDLIRHGAAPVEAAAHAGDRIVAGALTRLGWTETDLLKAPKTDAQKLEIARQLRRETVLSLPWIAERLHAGSVNTLRNALHAIRRSGQAESTPPGPGSSDARQVGLPRGGTPREVEAESAQATESLPFQVDWD